MPVLLAFALVASSAAPSPVLPPTAPRAVAAICVSVASGPGTGSTASFGAGLSADEGDDEAAVIAGIAKRGLYETKLIQGAHVVGGAKLVEFMVGSCPSVSY